MLQQFNEQNRKHVRGFEPQAIRLMQQYRWPGNVRELVNVVERAVVLCRGDEVTVNELPETIRGENRGGHVVVPAGPGNSLKRAMAEPERQIIIDALEANGWNRQNTARLLGINRTTLYKKMKTLGLDRMAS